MPPSPDIGQRIGSRYELIRRLAKGGMAEVWEAEDTILTRPVAVKILLPHLAADDQFVERFRREAVAAARLSHPHIVSIYDTCASEDCEAIVMELVRGHTLRTTLDDAGALPVRQAVEIAIQAADALSHAHANGLIHRDVKPGNILLSDDGRVLVTDFGIAKAAEATSDLTEVGQVVGTAKYLSPEQVQGKPLDARSDVYALGIVLYEMLCGRVPFSGENSTSTALARITTDALRPRQIRAGIPRGVEDVVLKAMARDPDQRFQSAAALRGSLLALDLSRIDDQTTSNEAISVVDPTPVPGDGELSFVRAERRWLVPAALIVVAAVVLGIVGVIVGQTDVGHTIFGGTKTTTPTVASQGVTITTPRSFDPFGDGEEHNELVGNLIDGNPGTSWYTQTYDSATFGTKPGVGVILPLAATTTLRTLQVDSPTPGWKASVYVADTPQSSFKAWGAPVATLNGGQTIALHNRRAGAVLIWITNLGPQRKVSISGVRLTH